MSSSLGPSRPEHEQEHDEICLGFRRTKFKPRRGRKEYGFNELDLMSAAAAKRGRAVPAFAELAAKDWDAGKGGARKGDPLLQNAATLRRNTTIMALPAVQAWAERGDRAESSKRWGKVREMEQKKAKLLDELFLLEVKEKKRRRRGRTSRGKLGKTKEKLFTSSIYMSNTQEAFTQPRRSKAATRDFHYRASGRCTEYSRSVFKARHSLRGGAKF